MHGDAARDVGHMGLGLPGEELVDVRPWCQEAGGAEREKTLGGTEKQSRAEPRRSDRVQVRLAGWDLKGGEGQVLRSAEGVVFRIESC